MKGFHKIHAIAHCSDCDWKEEDFRIATRKGRIHHKNTNHEVNVEIGLWKKYGGSND